MNILMILDGLFPPDERVEKEAVSLINEGHKVSIMCLNYGDQKDHEVYRGISVQRIRIKKSFRNKIQATYLIFPLYRAIWKKNIRYYLKANECDAIHIHDLPLSDIALSLKKKSGIRVICDQHEYYSNWIINTAHYNTPAGKFVSLLSNWKSYEKKCLSRADKVITVEEPLKKIYLEGLPINDDKIIVLPNTPSGDVFNNSNIDQEIVNRYQSDFVIFYAGHIDILRGLNTVIEALPILRETIPNLKFLMAGRFNSRYYNPLEYSKQLGVRDMVEYIEWIPLNQLPSYIAASQICLHVPPAISREVNNTVATKIYQYVLMHKPIITGAAEMMKEFVESNRIGLSILDSNPADFAEKVKLMHSSPELMKEFSGNAAKIAGKYSWEITAKPLIDYYNGI